ncbi:MAG: carboxypeptidase regulatory-like domain-containing protein [Niabella sp.]|nr:carboxypeptidase regulatory-like domain-containing protein [Niabella sp.]
MRTKIILLLLAHVFVASYACGQSGKLTGAVTDSLSNLPLESATVAFFRKDSSMVTYQLSDKNGKFFFEKLPVHEPLILNISYTGYTAYSKQLQLNATKTDTLNIVLSPNFNDSNAVTVTAIIPVKMNGDTLEINPAAFKMKSDAVVEELLNQVPGITIWSDGSITVNGKKVQNLFVDGKPFMGSTDPRVATQNLPKTAIDKIQLYQEYDRSNISKERKPQDSTLTMNIKLKEDSKKGYFGKAGIGYGTDNRYESDLSFQLYNKKTSFGIGGGLNNINKSIGNLQELFQNNTYRNYNPNLYNVGQFGASGINRNHSIGGVYTHEFNDVTNSRQNNRITLNYNKSGTDASITDLTLQNTTAVDNPQFVKTEGSQNNHSDKHQVGVNYVKTNSYNDNFTVNSNTEFNNGTNASQRFTEVRDSSGQLQSSNKVKGMQTNRSDNESVDISFAKSDEENPIKSFNLQVNGRRNSAITDREVQSIFNSYTQAGKDTSYNRRYRTSSDGINIGGTLDYGGFKRLLLRRYNLFNIRMSFGQWFNYTRNKGTNLVTDYDSLTHMHIPNSHLSNTNTKETIEYTPYLSLSKTIFKWRNNYSRNYNFAFKVSNDLKEEKNSSSIAERNLDRSFQFLRYEGNVSYFYSKRERYRTYGSISYTKNFDYPSIDQLYTIVDDINAYSIRYGNPDLKNKINHRVSMYADFNTENQKSPYSINGSINGGYVKSLNPIVDSIINEKSGKRSYYTINGDQSNNINFNYNFNISKRLNKNKIQLMYNGYFNNGLTPGYIDTVYTLSHSNSLSNQFTLQFSLQSLLILNAGEMFQTYRTRQTGKGLTSFQNNSNTTKFGLTLNYPKDVTFSSTLNIVHNSNLDKATTLWNAFASYRFMKQQGELKFSAMDILKQYQNITNSVDAQGTTTRITNGLQQFFMLTFSYYPRKFGKTTLQKKTNKEVW